MKKKIPAIIIIVFGVALIATHPVPGFVFVVIGAAMFAFASKKPKQTAVYTPSRIWLENLSIENVKSVMTKDPRFDNPKNKEKPVYRYMYFEQECTITPSGKKKYQVIVNDKVVGEISEDCKKTNPVLTLLGGERKVYADGEWVTNQMPFKGYIE